MKKKSWLGMALSGLAAGAVAGLFGAGGGMVLVPLLTLLTPLEESEVFPSSITIILPICLVTLAVSSLPLPGAVGASFHTCSAVPPGAGRRACGGGKSRSNGSTEGWAF